MIQDLDRCTADGDYFREQLGTDRGFLVTFDTYSEESIKQGDTEDAGFYGYESCEPDEFDGEGVTAVSKAIHFLTREHCVEPSSSSFHEGVWYSDYDTDTDYRTGEMESHSYHPTNFSVNEQRAIFNAVK